MSEHAADDSAVTLPPAVPLVSPSAPSSSPPPQPAAANASAANSPKNANAFELVLTLPPPSPVADPTRGLIRGSIRSSCARRNREQQRRYSDLAPEWRNWQTRRTQNPVALGPCGFDSHLRHLTVELNADVLCSDQLL